MIAKKLIFILLIGLCFVIINGCSKYLDKKPDAKLSVPNTLEDLQALMDYWVTMNQREPTAGNTSSDEYYVTAQDLGNATEAERNQYQWAASNLFPYITNDWANCYKIIYTANTVLENIEIIAKNKVDDWNNVKGQACFFRANAYLQAAFIWCLAYDEQSADIDLGLPLRLNTNFNELSTRASVKETYRQIIKDLNMAVALLPEKSVHPYRPSKAAAYSLLSRTYLSMREYLNAGKYADSALAIKNDLLDYNKLNPNATYPFSTWQFSANPEIIFEARSFSPFILAVTIAKVDSMLYKLYDANDLRKVVYFRAFPNNIYGFKGSYSGSSFFMGIATDELYLIKAETLVRSGEIAKAVFTLNSLLEKRWKTGTYTPFVSFDQDIILGKILQERQKQLYRRGLRWMDVKRLNKEGRQISFERLIDGKEYQLLPNDLRFALPIPEDVISMTGMAQNPR